MLHRLERRQQSVSDLANDECNLIDRVQKTIQYASKRLKELEGKHDFGGYKKRRKGESVISLPRLSNDRMVTEPSDYQSRRNKLATEHRDLSPILKTNKLF